MIDMWFWVGILASLCTATSGIPQALKMYRRKSSDDISAMMLWQIALGNAAWLLYGYGITSWPLMIASIFALMVVIIGIWLYYRYQQKKPRVYNARVILKEPYNLI